MYCFNSALYIVRVNEGMTVFKNVSEHLVVVLSFVSVIRPLLVSVTVSGVGEF